MKGLLLVAVFALVCSACSTTNYNSRSSLLTKNVTAEESLQRRAKKDLKIISESGAKNSGVAQCYLGDIREGLKTLKAQFEITNGPSYWNQLGVCYQLKKNFEKALFYYNIALQKNGHFAPALNNTALIYVEAKNYDRAIQSLKRAHVTAPKSKTIKINLANLYIKFGLNDKALGLLRPLYSRSNQDTDVLAAMATAYLMKNQLKTSQHYFRKIISEDLQREDIACHYALSLFLSGKDKAALSTLEQIDTTNHRELIKLKKKIENIIHKKQKVKKNG